MAVGVGSGSKSSRVDIPAINVKNINHWNFFFRIAVDVQGKFCLEVLDSVIPEDESEEDREERITQYGDTSKKLIAWLAQACEKNPSAASHFTSYVGPSWANGMYVYILNRYKAKGENRVGKLMINFHTLTMIPGETFRRLRIASGTWSLRSETSIQIKSQLMN